MNMWVQQAIDRMARKDWLLARVQESRATRLGQREFDM